MFKLVQILLFTLLSLAAALAPYCTVLAMLYVPVWTTVTHSLEDCIILAAFAVPAGVLVDKTISRALTWCANQVSKFGSGSGQRKMRSRPEDIYANTFVAEQRQAKQVHFRSWDSICEISGRAGRSANGE